MTSLVSVDAIAGHLSLWRSWQLLCISPGSPRLFGGILTFGNVSHRNIMRIGVLFPSALKIGVPSGSGGPCSYKGIPLPDYARFVVPPHFNCPLISSHCNCIDNLLPQLRALKDVT